MAQNNSFPGSHNIASFQLSNGINVLIHENHTVQSVVIAGSFQAGSIFDTPNQSGLAALTAGAVMRGTKSREFDQIHDELEGIGASLSVNSGTHQANFYGKSLSEDLGILVQNLSDVLRHPTFPADQVERLRGETLTALHLREQSTRYRASRTFQEQLYPPEHPYHYSNSGSIESVTGLNADMVRNFHAQHYGPAGMVIVIVGAVTAEGAFAAVEQAFADWDQPQQPIPPLPTIEPLTTIQREYITLTGKSQADIILGVRGPSRADSNYLAASLANSILGQFGMMGRIGATVREQLGLAYYASSRISGGHGPRPWSVSAGVAPHNIELTLNRIQSEIKRLIDEPVNADELADNQAYFTGHLPLQLESNEGIAGAILNMVTYDLGLDYLTNYRRTIYNFTADDLLVAVQAYWNPNAFVIAVAGPA